jgi:hypothetical protein
LFLQFFKTWKFEFLDLVLYEVIFSPSNRRQKGLLGLKKGAGEEKVSCVQPVLGLLALCDLINLTLGHVLPEDIACCNGGKSSYVYVVL